ncbi:MAG TPA: hypothetical protein VK689_03360 [Armatimonadota bacterium]|nr:hypothetical protein [Armatimonadota bacterium]
MAKRKAPSPVFSAWERIVFETPREEGRYPPEAEDEWAVLWQEHIEGENLAQSTVDDASILCTLGWSLAMQRRDFPAALARASRYFEHPDWEQGDETTREILLGYIAEAKWGAGDEGGALDDLRQLLQRQRRYRPGPLLIVRSVVDSCAQERPPDERAPEDFARLTAEVVSRFQGCVRLSRSITPGTDTYAQLRKVFEQTRPVELLSPRP